MRPIALLVAILVFGSAVAQFQPLSQPDLDSLVERTDLSNAGELDGALRVARFVQVSDAHVVDDDAPAPMRVDALDDVFFGTTVSDGAARPQDEFTDEVLNAMIESINRLHLEDGLDFVMNTGDNIDNQLENELMRFIDNWEGTYTTEGPISGLACQPDGQDAAVEDACTHLPASLVGRNTALVGGLPWFSAFGNHDGLIQGNVPIQPSFNDLAAEFGRQFLEQTEYVAMHFRAGTQCLQGSPAGSFQDDYGHGYGFAAGRLCDEDPDNDGYYAFDHRGIRYIVLDTINDDFVNNNALLAGNFVPQATLGYDLAGGYSEGALDPVQYQWMLDQVDTNTDKLIVIFSHHTVNSMFSGKTEPACCGPNGESLEDLLLEAGYQTGPGIEAALAERPNVVAWIGGHTHKHNIEAKTSFWNIETSSLIDLPQEARAMEIWLDGTMEKGALVIERINHTFQQSKDLAATDDQFDSVESNGEDVDRDVLLWFDIPAGVQLEPQPTLPQSLVIKVVEPVLVNGTHGAPGNITVVVQITENLASESVSGLDVGMTVSHNVEGQRVTDFEALMKDLGGGSYSAQFHAPDEATYFANFLAVDPNEDFNPQTQLVSFIVDDGEAPEVIKKKSPGLPVAVSLLILAFLARR